MCAEQGTTCAFSEMGASYYATCPRTIHKLEPWLCLLYLALSKALLISLGFAYCTQICQCLFVFLLASKLISLGFVYSFAYFTWFYQWLFLFHLALSMTLPISHDFVSWLCLLCSALSISFAFTYCI